MYRTGHYGVSLLAYAPVGFALAVAGRVELALLGGWFMLWLAMLPDYDQRLPFVRHRGPTHTLVFALLVGSVLGAAGYLVGRRYGVTPTYAAFGFFVGVYSVLAHLLADSLTPAGLRPFWPLSDRFVSLSVTRASNGLANYLLFALGVFATAVAAITALRFW